MEASCYEAGSRLHLLSTTVAGHFAATQSVYHTVCCTCSQRTSIFLKPVESKKSSVLPCTCTTPAPGTIPSYGPRTPLGTICLNNFLWHFLQCRPAGSLLLSGKGLFHLLFSRIYLLNIEFLADSCVFHLSTLE